MKPTVWTRSALLVACGMAGVALPAVGQGLPMAKPQEVGMSAEGLAGIDKVMQKFIDDKQLAGAVTIVARRGKVVRFEACSMRDISATSPSRNSPTNSAEEAFLFIWMFAHHAQPKGELYYHTISGFAKLSCILTGSCQTWSPARLVK